MEWLRLEQWSPYLVGAGIGVLECLSFLLSDKPLSCSTAYSRTSGMIEALFRGAKVKEKAYYRKFVPMIEWDWMLVLGVVVGAFLSAQLSGQFRPDWVPAKWAGTFGHLGHNPLVRWGVSLVGGIIMGLGARWAGGCTSGHGISGTLQLAISSWLAAACFFIGGIMTAKLFLTSF